MLSVGTGAEIPRRSGHPPLSRLILCSASESRRSALDLSGNGVKGIAAGTVVVRTPKLARPDVDQLQGGKYNSLAEIRHLAARLRQKVRPEMGSIALEALLRRDEIEPKARLALFEDLAGHFRGVVEYPPEVVEQLSDEQYVRNVVEILFKEVASSQQPVASRG